MRRLVAALLHRLAEWADTEDTRLADLYATLNQKED